MSEIATSGNLNDNFQPAIHTEETQTSFVRQSRGLHWTIWSTNSGGNIFLLKKNNSQVMVTGYSLQMLSLIYHCFNCVLRVTSSKYMVGYMKTFQHSCPHPVINPDLQTGFLCSSVVGGCGRKTIFSV